MSRCFVDTHIAIRQFPYFLYESFFYSFTLNEYHTYTYEVVDRTGGLKELLILWNQCRRKRCLLFECVFALLCGSSIVA